jgi:hypothetical protein
MSLAASTAQASNKPMKTVGILSLVLIAAISAAASDLPSSFRDVVARAEAQEKAPATKRYFSTVLLPYYGQKYAPVLQSCFATVATPDNSPFSFVAAFGSEGKVLRIYADHETNIYTCLCDALKKEVFPAPPQSPYYLHIDMQFTDPPPPNASGEPAPPLIVEPNKYSYTFGVPPGWESNFEQAHQRGAALAFFLKGGTFNDSSSVIYVNEISEACTGDCLSPLAQSIAKTLRDVKADSPTVAISTADSIKTKDGVSATIRILKGSKDPRAAGHATDNEALAFIAHDETVILVVLTARDSKTWDQDYNAFQQVVAGHKFFTCNRPDGAVPCGK